MVVNHRVAETSRYLVLMVTVCYVMAWCFSVTIVDVIRVKCGESFYLFSINLHDYTLLPIFSLFSCAAILQCLDSLVQFGGFLSTHFSAEEYGRRVPKIDDLGLVYHIPADIAFFVVRPIIRNSINVSVNIGVC